MKLHIPSPCQEDIQQMTPTEKGRYCSQCQKCIIDFRKMSHSSIRYYIQDNPQSCGIFNTTQLADFNRQKEPIARFPFWMRYFPLGVLGVGFGLKAQQNDSLQIEPELIYTETEIIKNPNCSTIPSKEIRLGKPIFQKTETNDSITTVPEIVSIITGTLVDIDGFPIANAEVIIPGNSKSVLTDWDGNFEILGEVGQVLEITDELGEKQTFSIHDENMGTLTFAMPMTVGVLVVHRKFHHKALRTLSYPYRKVRSWIRGW